MTHVEKSSSPGDKGDEPSGEVVMRRGFYVGALLLGVMLLGKEDCRPEKQPTPPDACGPNIVKIHSIKLSPSSDTTIAPGQIARFRVGVRAEVNGSYQTNEPWCGGVLADYPFDVKQVDATAALGDRVNDTLVDFDAPVLVTCVDNDGKLSIKGGDSLSEMRKLKPELGDESKDTGDSQISMRARSFLANRKFTGPDSNTVKLTCKRPDSGGGCTATTQSGRLPIALLACLLVGFRRRRARQCGPN